MTTPRLLFVGDAVRPTGFERVSRAVLTELQGRGWEIHQLGINYHGDPDKRLPPWPVYPASLGGDLLGIGRMAHVHNEVKPDLTLILQDSWVVPLYFEGLPAKAPVAAYIPVDAPNQPMAGNLQRLQMAITYTLFGAQELRVGGYQGRLAVIPHGIDTDLFTPMDKKAARRELGMNPAQVEGFIIGNVNRNQPRKRLDAFLLHWKQWWEENGRPKDAYCLLHCQLQDAGWDLMQLARYLGIIQQCIFTGGREHLNFSPVERLVRVYNTLDGQANTGLGEGWGLTTMEGMACGVAQIAGRTGAMPEWARAGVLWVNCHDTIVTMSRINTLGGVIDPRGFINAINDLYHHPDRRAELGENGRDLVKQQRFTWHDVGRKFDEALRRIL